MTDRAIGAQAGCLPSHGRGRQKYFEKNFDKDKEFRPEELKEVVKELTTNRQRITQTMDEIGVPMTGADARRKRYSSYIEDDDEYYNR